MQETTIYSQTECRKAYVVHCTLDGITAKLCIVCYID